MKKKILLVDDTQTVLMSEKMMLAGQGFEISMAKNGVEAIEVVTADPPDLILLDIMMPEMNGIEFCRRVKENPETRAIPVIMVTTKGEQEKVEESFAAGCNDYVTKPIDKLQLLTKIRNFIS